MRLSTMNRKETILHIAGDYDVRRDRHGYTVCRHAGTHAVTVQTFAERSLAIAYANYKAGARGKATLKGVASSVETC